MEEQGAHSLGFFPIDKMWDLKRSPKILGEAEGRACWLGSKDMPPISIIRSCEQFTHSVPPTSPKAGQENGLTFLYACRSTWSLNSLMRDFFPPFSENTEFNIDLSDYSRQTRDSSLEGRLGSNLAFFPSKRTLQKTLTNSPQQRHCIKDRQSVISRHNCCCFPLPHRHINIMNSL